MLDIALLRIMKYQKEYKHLKDVVPKVTLDQKTKVIIEAFGKYFIKFPEHKVVQTSVFIPRFLQWYSTFPSETLSLYKKIIRNIEEDVDEGTRSGIISDLYEADAAVRIANICAEYDAGELAGSLPDIISGVLDKCKLYNKDRLLAWDDRDITELLKEDVDQSGIKWRLNCLNEVMRPLRGGDFGIIAARVDKGKTTFLASETTHMAKQLKPDQNIIWLNNEGQSGRIVKRVWQAAIGKSISELIKLDKAGKLKKMYLDALGRVDRIRVFDIHGCNAHHVDIIMENNSPGVVVYDMLDNIEGFGSEARTDLQLEALYQWGRERAVKHNSIGLATSQLSADADGLQFPPLHMLKDSKTGKQGACDFAVFIGAQENKALEHIRYISTPKNKLRRDGAASSPNAEVIFNPLSARYSEGEYLDDE